MIQIDTHTQFYYENETISLPKTFTYIGQVGKSYLYGNGQNGREVEYTKNADYGWGWTVKSVSLEAIENCCKG